MSLCINPQCLQPLNPDMVLFCQTCGSELLLNGRYRVVKKLGGGGFGKTFTVLGKGGETKVLKILTNNHPKAVELFAREADVLKCLSHPGIPKVETDGYFIYFPRNSQTPIHCLVMEKIEGLNLREYMHQRGHQPIEQNLAIAWLTELTEILHQVHGQNFFHRDIKPANIMLRSNGGLALIDFGTARQITGTYLAKQAAGGVTGIVSSGYTPPEQINGQAVQQSDFFALARTFVYLLTATDPGLLYDIDTDGLKWRDAHSLNLPNYHHPQISPQFADLIDAMMARLPSQRPSSTTEILQRLREISHPPVTVNLNIAPILIHSPTQILAEIELKAIQPTFIQQKRSFFYQWMLASVVGLGIGLFLRSLVSALVYSLVGDLVGLRYAMLSAIVTALPVEWMQWMALRRRIHWDFWSISEIAFAILIGLVTGAITGKLLFANLGQIVGALVGIFTGTAIAKWLIFRRQLKRTFFWLITAIISIPSSVIVGAIAAIIFNLILPKIWSLNTSFAMNFAIGITISIFFWSSISGIAIAWLLRHRKF